MTYNCKKTGRNDCVHEEYVHGFDCCELVGKPSCVADIIYRSASLHPIRPSVNKPNLKEESNLCCIVTN